MPALEVLGAVTGCVSLAFEIYAFFQNELRDAENDMLILSIKHDIGILRDFGKIFNAASQDERMTEADKLLLDDLCLALRPGLDRVHSLVFRRQLSDLTASRARKAKEKVLGFLYKKGELQRISRELLQWVERYHIRFGLLQLDLQRKLLAGNPETETSTTSSLQALRETFAALALKGQGLSDTGLVKTESEFVFRPGPTSSRMFASWNQELVAIELKPHKNTLVRQELSLFEAEVVKLVKLLSCVDVALSRVLQAKGYFHQTSQSCFAFIYQLPRNVVIPADLTRPTTLLELLSTTRETPNRPGHAELVPPKHPLEQRFELARQIACAVMYVHMMQYVHKSIRSSNIIILPKKDASEDYTKRLGEPFLCGFETARHNKATSDQTGDAHWKYNIYRHPKRQGLFPQERYSMNHDIYSLGVVLLEIGLWRPLLSTGLAKLKDSPEEEIVAGKIKTYLKRLAVERLPVLVGTKYCDVVLFCLSIDGDGQVGHSSVIEELLSKLEDLSAGMH